MSVKSRFESFRKRVQRISEMLCQKFSQTSISPAVEL